MNKSLMLGTAQWGWTVHRTEAFRMLDAWLAAGQTRIDAATNYPINKNPDDFRASEKILLEYVQAHGLSRLQITMKIGSVNNLRTPDVNLSPSFIRMLSGEYRRLFDSNLSGIMLHWDNRDDEGDIRATLNTMKQIQEETGLQPGLSGIRHPERYAAVNEETQLSFDIELKYNVLHSDIERYAPIFSTGSHRVFAYGINAGGIKMEGPYPAGSAFLARGGNLEKAELLTERLRALLPKWNTAFVRPPLRTMNQLGLIYGLLNPGIDGLVLGFSSTAQLNETLDFIRNIDVYDYSDVEAELRKIAAQLR